MAQLFMFGLSKPQTQTQEVFYMLIKNARRHHETYRGVSRKDFMDDAYVMNSPACICNLRKAGVSIKRKEVEVKNKFGRSVSYSKYFIGDDDLRNMTNLYESMVKQSKK